jgi:hypothetical protein
VAVFELHEEAVRALQELGVIGSKRYPPSLKYKRLDEIDVSEVPAGFSRPAEKSQTNRSVRWAAHESWGLKSPRRSDEGRCIQRRG